jgi:hypothetical protein
MVQCRKQAPAWLIPLPSPLQATRYGWVPAGPKNKVWRRKMKYGAIPGREGVPGAAQSLHGTNFIFISNLSSNLHSKPPRKNFIFSAGSFHRPYLVGTGIAVTQVEAEVLL